LLLARLWRRAGFCYEHPALHPAQARAASSREAGRGEMS